MPGFEGKCACGQITYQILDKPKEVGICHCKICQAVSGGVYFFLETKQLKVQNEDKLTKWPSSEYCDRAFCSLCGSNLYCFIKPMNAYHVSPGSLADWKDLKLTHEIFIDRKPTCYNLQEKTEQKTGDEMYALWSSMG